MGVRVGFERWGHIGWGWASICRGGGTSNVAAALDRMQGPNKIDRTFCLLCTCLAAVPVLGWLKGRCRLP